MWNIILISTAFISNVCRCDECVKVPGVGGGGTCLCRRWCNDCRIMFTQDFQISAHVFLIANCQFFFMAQHPPLYRSLTITLRHTTLCRTPLDGCSARRRYLSVTTHNTLKRQISLPSAEFEPAVPAGEQPQTQALDRAANGIGDHQLYVY